MLTQPDEISENYIVQELLYRRNKTRVYKALRKDGVPVAIKRISKKEQPRYKKEIRVGTELSEECFVRTFEVFERKSFVYVVMEYCEEGALESRLKQRKSVAEKTVQEIFRQLLVTLFRLYQKEIVHRDIKPENIFLTKRNPQRLGDIMEQPDNMVLKLGDFGLSFYVSEPELDSACGTPLYMAPECLLQKQGSYKSDVWSVGVILYRLLHGVFPCRAQTPPKLLAVLKQNKRIQCSREIHCIWRELIRIFLEYSPERRFGMDGYMFLEQSVYWANREEHSHIDALYAPAKTDEMHRKFKALFYFQQLAHYLTYSSIAMQSVEEGETPLEDGDRIFGVNELAAPKALPMQTMLLQIQRVCPVPLNERTARRYLSYYAKILYRHGVVAQMFGRGSSADLFFRSSTQILACLKSKKRTKAIK